MEGERSIEWGEKGDKEDLKNLRLSHIANICTYYLDTLAETATGRGVTDPLKQEREPCESSEVSGGFLQGSLAQHALPTLLQGTSWALEG